MRRARSRGVGSRVRPYVIVGVIIALAATGISLWLVTHPGVVGLPWVPASVGTGLMLRLVSPEGAIGLALLVLARVERNGALLVFGLAYLVVVGFRLAPRPAVALALRGDPGGAAPARQRRLRHRRTPCRAVVVMTDHPVNGLDDVVHQRVRLGILAIAHEARRVEFGFLRGALELTAGNLGQHLSVLERAELVRIEKGYEGSRPRTWVHLTGAGEKSPPQRHARIALLARRPWVRTG